ncbi:MAG TPA: hypothetical protein VK150_06960 [Geothrix sp.]|nr:hypothetical protein [Geothrix sp.]
MNLIPAWLRNLITPRTKPKPKPWEDPNRSPQDREAWRRAEPKSLRRSA